MQDKLTDLLPEMDLVDKALKGKLDFTKIRVPHPTTTKCPVCGSPKPYKNYSCCDESDLLEDNYVS